MILTQCDQAKPGTACSHFLKSLNILFDKINTAKYTNSIFMKSSNIQYVSDEKGDRIAVIVPIEIWEKLTGEDETSYLLKSKTIKTRLIWLLVEKN